MLLLPPADRLTRCDSHVNAESTDIRTDIPWRKLLRDTVVVVGSVYLAIVLEGASDTRARHADAERALGRLATELAQDRADLEVVLQAQRDRHVRHDRIDRWLGDGDFPADSLSADFTALFSVNRTMFPRDASWATMVASDQLTDLDDPALVARLANFYENLNERLEYNGALYDEWVSQVAQSALPLVWNRVDGRLMTTDPDEIDGFRTRLLALLDLSLGFYTLLEEWGAELDAVIAEVHARTDPEGRGA